MPSSFQNLVARMNKSDYIHDEERTISGLTYMGLQAILLGETGNFTYHLQIIKKALDNHETHKNLNDINLRYFLDHLELFQQLHNNEKMNESIAVNYKKNLYFFENLVEVYQYQELIYFFKVLKENITATTKQTVAFILSNTKNMITIGFSRIEQKWSFMDPENFSIDFFDSEVTLVQNIFKSLRVKNSFIGISLKFYSALEDKSEAKKIAKICRNIIHDISSNIEEKDKIVHLNEHLLLHIALKNKQLEIFEKLINNGHIDINKQNSNGETALHIAVQKRYTEIVRALLLVKDIDVNLSDNNGQSPLHVAAKNNYVDVLDILIAHPNIKVNQYNQNSITPLFIAILKNNIEIIKSLLSHKNIQVNKTINNGVSPLFIAIRNKNIETVKALLNHPNIDVNKEDYKGHAPLPIAIFSDQEDIVKLLLSMDSINVNQVIINNYAPLQLALDEKKTNITRMLFESGALFNLADVEKLSQLLSIPQVVLINELKKRVSEKKYLPLRHSELIEHMQSYGYYADKTGMCNGISFIGLQAVLTGKIKEFNSRLKKIKTNIETKNNMVFLDILTFYDGIMMFQKEKALRFIQNRRTEKNIRGKTIVDYDINSIVQSIALEKKGGFYYADDFMGVFKINELITLLETFKKIAISNTSESVGLLFSCNNHIITVGFEPLEEKWIFIDSNNFPAKMMNSETFLAHQISNALSANNEFVLLSVKFYTTLLIKRQADCIAQEWKESIKTILLESISIKRAYIKNKQGENLLLMATAEGEIDIVRTLLNDENVDINITCNRGITPLFSAVLQEHSEIAKILLNHGLVNVNKTTIKGATPLYTAASLGQTEIVERLLTYSNINVNQTTVDGLTPLHAAIIKRNKEIIKILLNHHSIDANINSSKYGTPLYLAIKTTNEEIVDLLLERHDIDVNKIMGNNLSPLQIATHNNKIDIILSLLKNKHIKINQAEDRGYTSLDIAIIHGNLEIVNILLEDKNIDVNHTTNNGMTPLCIAIQKKHVHITKALLEHENIDINTNLNSGLSVLHLAAKSQHSEIVKLIFNHPKLTEKKDSALFKWGVIHGCVDLINELLKSKSIEIDLNAYEQSLLNYALENKNIVVVQKLLSRQNISDKLNHDDTKSLDLTLMQRRPVLISSVKKRKAIEEPQEKTLFKKRKFF